MSGKGFILTEEFVADVAGLALEDEIVAVGSDLLDRHEEPQRRYHGVSHLAALIELMAKHAANVAHGSPPRLAIWWHDAIYIPQARDNEERSADLARDHLSRLGAAPAIIDETCRLILMTKNH